MMTSRNMDIKRKERDMRNKIDKVRLIRLIEARPVIWDKFLDNYKTRSVREQAWREICLELLPDFENMRKSDRHLFRTSVIKTWTQVRDAWLKTLHPNRQTRPYIYHVKLLFLSKVLNPVKRSHYSSDSESESENITSIKEETEVYADNEIEEPSNQNDDSSAKMISFVNQASSSQNLDNNESRMIVVLEQSTTERHMNFFKSILPSLTSLDDDQILEFHSAVISALQSIKKR